jgi:beta-glucosidase
MARRPRRLHPAAQGGRTDDQGRPKGILGNTELLPVIGNFPISTLAAFPGLGFTHDLIHALADQISASDR